MDTHAVAIAGFPRSRGDEPIDLGDDNSAEAFSPLTRG